MFLQSDERQRLVRNIFDRIAARYDLLNRIISFRLDARWRKKALRVGLRGGERLVLDLGTGTGDLALAAAAAIERRGRVFGLDISPEMLRLAQAKRKKNSKANDPLYVLGSALAPPFKDDVFDAVVTAFVLRNVADLGLFFIQAYRLLKPGGRIVSLDMFPPSGNFFSPLYSLYFYHLVPWIGAGLARDRDAYRYLSESVKHFASPEAVAQIVQRAGFREVSVRRFLRGAVCLHVGEKPISAASQPDLHAGISS
jgi:demethylmenaquinone methyltransferase/2-methoxy-6-polyprenyl-1,4-benzoquinol methylase